MKKVISLMILLTLIFTLSFVVSALDYSNIEDIDLEGRTITWGSWSLIEPPEGSPEYERMKEAEEKANFNAEFRNIYSEGDIIELIVSGVMAGDPPVDILRSQTSKVLPNLVREGALLPLDNVLDDEYWNEVPEFIQPMRETVTIDGHIYGMTTRAPVLNVVAVIWNKGLFDEEGLPNIYDLIEDGEWTWEKMREIAIEATKDKNGDGEIDQWGINGFPTVMELATPGIIEAYGGPVTEEVDGKIEFTWDEGQQYEAWKYFYELRNVDQVIRPSSYPGYDPEEFNNGEIAMNIIWLSRYNGSKYSDVDYGLAPLPKHPEEDDYNVIVPSAIVDTIPITEENPEALARIHHYIWGLTSEDDMVMRANEGARDENGYELFLEMAKNYKVADSNISYVGKNTYKPLIRAIHNGEATYEIWKEAAPEIQAKLDDAFEQ